MKITREVNGVPMEFELTKEELFFAHAEQVHARDVQFIADAFVEERFDDLSDEDREQAYHDIAYRYREIYVDMDEPDAFEAARDAIEEYFDGREVAVGAVIEAATRESEKQWGIDLSEYELSASRVDDYDIFRKILRDEDGRPVNVVWAAAKDGVEPFAITYEQALGDEPIDNSPVKALGRQLGEILLS